MKNTVWSYFSEIYCLSTHNDRPSGKPSRWPEAEKEIKAAGIEHCRMFKAAPINPAKGVHGPHQSFNLSQKLMLESFVSTGLPFLLTLEDDVKFQNLDALNDAIIDIMKSRIPWDVLYLGGNINGNAVKVRRHLFKVFNVWTTHAVAYTRNAAIYLLKSFPPISEKMYDVYLGENSLRLNMYMINPIVAVQKPEFSDLWNKQVDYTGAFTQSQNKMRL